jgi:hypothetical protein
MAERPQLTSARLAKAAAALAVQFFLIGVAVFLGLQADQWREDRDHRATVRATLLNFRTEVAQNRAEVLARLPYHRALADSMSSGLRRPTATIDEVMSRFRFDGKPFRGMSSVDFARTAWDLAIATDALSYMDPALAFAIADVYHQQQVFQNIQNSFLSNLFTPDYFREENGRSALIAVSAYMGDVSYQEPHMLELYDKLQPRLDSALGLPRDAAAPPDPGGRR